MKKITDNIWKVLMIASVSSASTTWVIYLCMKYEKSINMFFLQYWNMIGIFGLFCGMFAIFFIIVIGVCK